MGVYNHFCTQTRTSTQPLTEICEFTSSLGKALVHLEQSHLAFFSLLYTQIPKAYFKKSVCSSSTFVLPFSHHLLF